MFYISGIIGPAGIIAMGTFYLLLLIPSLFMIIRNEKNMDIFMWILIAVVLPFAGSILYFSKYLIHRLKKTDP